jgi:hypothetical protein
MTFQITNPAFSNYTGSIGKTEWVDGKTDSIPDRLDEDMIRLTMGLQVVAEAPETSPSE